MTNEWLPLESDEFAQLLSQCGVVAAQMGHAATEAATALAELAAAGVRVTAEVDGP